MRLITAKPSENPSKKWHSWRPSETSTPFRHRCWKTTSDQTLFLELAMWGYDLSVLRNSQQPVGMLYDANNGGYASEPDRSVWPAQFGRVYDAEPIVWRAWSVSKTPVWGVCYLYFKTHLLATGTPLFTILLHKAFIGTSFLYLAVVLARLFGVAIRCTTLVEPSANFKFCPRVWCVCSISWFSFSEIPHSSQHHPFCSRIQCE